MKIYFDGVLVDQEYYVSIKKNAKVYDGNFKMGATVCKNYVFEFDKQAVSSAPSVITLYNNQNTLLETLNVVKIEDKDNFTTIVYAEDYMTKFNFKYNPKDSLSGNIYSLQDVLTDICTKAGVPLYNPQSINLHLGRQFTNVNPNLMARDYIQFIGEVSQANFVITSDNKLMPVVANPSILTDINSDISEYRIGTQHLIQRVVFDSWNSWKYGTDGTETYYINPDNIAINASSNVEAIYNAINDLTFYDIKLNDVDLTDKDNLLGTICKIQLDGTDYSFYFQYEDAVYYQEGTTGKWVGTVNVQINNEQQNETEIIGTDDKIRTVKRIVDYDNGRITQEISDRQSADASLGSRITQTANAIESEVTRATGAEGNLGTRISQTAKSIALTVSNGSTSSGITITTTKEDGTTTETTSGTIQMNGLVSFTNLSTSGQTTINGGNITTGEINCSLLNGGTINGQTISGGTITGTDITATNSLKIGSNQSSTSTDVKYLKMSDNVYLKRTKTGSLETGELYLGGDGAIKILGSNGTFNAILINNGQVSLSNDWGQYVDLNNNDGTVNISSINTSWIDAGNIDCGSGSCSSNGETHINFNKTFTSIPKIIATPNTRTNGVIALKITGKSTTGFDITIGGQGFSNNEPFDWIAMN